MRIKIAFALFAAMLSISLAAQTRQVVGCVFDADGMPLKGAVVTLKSSDVSVTVGDDGRFSIEANPYVKYVVASKDGYLSQEQEIDGSVLVFRLSVDKKALQEIAARKKAEAAAKARAEEEKRLAEERALREAEERAAAAERARIEEERRVAAMKAKAEAEERARIAAEEAAKAKAEAERRKAEEKAEKEAEKARKAAEAKAEAEARAAVKAQEQAERERLLAEEKAFRIAEAEAAKERKEQNKASKVKPEAVKDSMKASESDVRRKRMEEYEKVYKCRGLINSFELSYGCQLAGGEVIYVNHGYKPYGGLNPVEFDYMIGWRFNHLISLSAGAGVSCNMTGLGMKGDRILNYYDSNLEHEAPGYDRVSPIDVPVFLNMKLYLSRGRVQPVVSLSGGIYALSTSIMAECGAGCLFRFGKVSNLYAMASLRLTPWPVFKVSESGASVSQTCGHKPVFTPGIKVGYTF